MSHLKFILLIVFVFVIAFTLGINVNQNVAQQEIVVLEEPVKNQQNTADKNKTNLSVPPLNDKIIAKLKEQILALEKQLVAEKEHTNSLIKEGYSSFEETESKRDPVQTRITKEEIGDNLPSPFSELVASMKGDVVDKFKQLQSETVDYEWAIVMKQNITDYIVTHELSGDVELQSVICKTSICEIRGFEAEIGNKSWSVISAGMQSQTWWVFHKSHNTSVNNDQLGKYFYLLTDKEV